MYVSKAERERVYAMFGGRCAYCGRELPKRWHVDHLEPVVRVGGAALMPERHTAENFMPACPPCNLDKHAMTPDGWRRWLETRRQALLKTPGFRLLSAHGLVADTEAPIVFYFERTAPNI